MRVKLMKWQKLEKWEDHDNYSEPVGSLARVKTYATRREKM